MRFHSVSHAHRSTTTDRSLNSNAHLTPLSMLTHHQHGVPESPENVYGGTLVGGEDDDERACEPDSVMRVDLSHKSLQWRVARSARPQLLQLSQCLLTAPPAAAVWLCLFRKWSDRSAWVLSAVEIADAT